MRKKFLVCILLPCCILIAACGHTADTKNDLLSENITSDTETDTQTSDYEKYNNYGSTEERSPMKYSSRKRTTRVSRRGSLSHSGIMVRSSSLSPLFIRMNRLLKTRLQSFGKLLRNWKSRMV